MVVLVLGAVAAIIALCGGLTLMFGAGAIGFFLLIGIAAALKAGPIALAIVLAGAVWAMIRR